MSADSKILRAHTAGQRVGVIGYDAPLEDDAREEHRRHVVLGQVAVAVVAGAHFADDLPLAQQVLQPLAPDDSEPRPVAVVLQRLASDRGADLRHGAGPGYRQSAVEGKRLSVRV